MNKSLLIIVIIVSVCFVLTACDLETTDYNNQSSQGEQKAATNENKNKNKTSNNETMDTLRKCTVMEAADLYRGNMEEGAFDKAKETCLELQKIDDFDELINQDWENRKEEEIEGKPLSYYLDILGW